MNSKQRVRTALARREPDRVPMGEFAFDHTLIEHFFGRRSWWRPFSNADAQLALWAGRRDQVVEGWKQDVVELTERFEFDMVPCWLAPSRYRPIEAPRQVGPGLWEDSGGNRFQYSAQTDSIQQVFWADADRPLTVEDFADRDFAEPDDSELEFVRFVVGQFGRSHFVFARSGDGSFPQPGGLQRALVLMIEQPEVMQAAIEQATVRCIELDRIFAREGVDGLAPGADYATTRGLMFDPKLFERLMLPAIKRQTAAAHDLGLFVLKHACGNNWAILDGFVEAGYDAYQSIQGSAGMHLQQLKQRYGSRLALWGGVQVETLVRGSPQQIRREVIDALTVAGPGGGFILGSSHSIVNATRPENYLAMIEAWREFRDYPIRIDRARL
ncbi:MAG: uroporphyrinogen decarboxylase family protein [Phycisphaerae bacterium]